MVQPTRSEAGSLLHPEVRWTGLCHNRVRYQSRTWACPSRGSLREGRAAKPTARAALSAFGGLEGTYTANGLVLDRLSQLQRRTLALPGIPLPWPEKERTNPKTNAENGPWLRAADSRPATF